MELSPTRMESHYHLHRIYIKNTTYGVSSNAFGEYFIELKPGKYTIVYSYIGYQSKEKIYYP